MSAGRRCQSCGMPLGSDPKGGGTDADGRLSGEYCSYCYVGGKYINPDMTIEEMRALVIDKLRERGFPGFIARMFAAGLGRLKRWR